MQDWLRRAIEHSGKQPTALARAAGLSHSTITRFLNGEDGGALLSARSIMKIEQASGLPFRRDVGFAESEVTPIAGEMPSGNMTRWKINTMALCGLGYMPTDIAIVDTSARPQEGDIVVAQRYHWSRGTAKTIFRLYLPPYLVASCSTPRLLKPFLVDNDQVAIMGVVTGIERERGSATPLDALASDE